MGEINGLTILTVVCRPGEKMTYLLVLVYFSYMVHLKSQTVKSRLSG